MIRSDGLKASVVALALMCAARARAEYEAGQRAWEAGQGQDGRSPAYLASPKKFDQGLCPWSPRGKEVKTQELRERLGNTEPDDIVPTVSSVAVAEGRAENPRTAVPGAAAQAPTTTIACFPCPAITRCAIVMPVPAVLHPFPYIAVHVV